MTPEEMKSRFDALASTLWAAVRELELLSAHLTTRIDQNAARSIISDLAWATENCTVLGLHQVGEALDDDMLDAQPHGPQQVSRTRRCSGHPPCRSLG